MSQRRQALRVGTDYSGMETPLIALQSLGVPFHHCFASEVCPKARAVIEEKFQPDVLFGDALQRKSTALPDKLDLYVAGFPCQLFSSLRHISRARLGTKDSRAADVADPLRHFLACLKAIRKCRPSVFVLENVPALRSYDKGRTWDIVRNALKRLRSYHVSTMVLNALDYGSPQNRARLFIVGVRCDEAAESVESPPKARKQKSFESLLETGSLGSTLSATKRRWLQRCSRDRSVSVPPFFATVNLLPFRCSFAQHPPTLTADGRGIYSSATDRVTTVREDMRLQGIPDSFSFPSSISKSWCRRLVGNSMSVDVMKHLLAECLTAIGRGKDIRKQCRTV